MKVEGVALLAVFVCATPVAARLVACSCELANTVCLTEVEMSEHAVHVAMEPDRMGNHANYRGVAVFQIGFDEKGHATGANTISGHPLGIAHLIAAVSKWRFKPIIVKGVKKKGCGELSIKFAMTENVPTAEVLRQPVRNEKPRGQSSIDEKSRIEELLGDLWGLCKRVIVLVETQLALPIFTGFGKQPRHLISTEAPLSCTPVISFSAEFLYSLE